MLVAAKSIDELDIKVNTNLFYPRVRIHFMVKVHSPLSTEHVCDAPWLGVTR